MPEVVLIRHAESQSNLDGIWNGRLDGPLSAEGETSLDLIGKRLHDKEFDVVISSPLERARRTAGAFASNFEVSDDFIELDIGKWEGLGRDEVLSRDGDYLREAIYGRELPMGETGESLSDLQLRADRAIDSLAGRLDEDGRAVVVTHGGFIQEALHGYLAGRGGRRAHVFAGNTSITRLVWSYDRPRLAVFNDMGHLGPRPAVVQEHLDKGEPVIALVRHGQTRANIERRWQGQGDWGLDETGRSQAQALGDWYGQVATVYSSPLGRAHTTASYLAGNGVVTVDGLKEIAM